MLLLCIPLASLAADPSPAVDFTPHAQVRPRVEMHTGKDGVSDNGNITMVTQRARLGATLASGDVKARIILQDVRAWGSELDTLGDPSADFFDAHEAWLRVGKAKNVQLTVGRQELALHEHRLIGTVDWAQQGRSFDAARVQGRTGDISGELAAALLAEGDLVGIEEKDSGLLIFRGGWNPKADGKPGPNQADLVAIWDTNTALDRDRQTVGVYAKGGNGAVKGRVEGYYQLGTVGTADIGAHMVGVSGTYTLDVTGKPSLTLWYDRLSGDDDLTDGNLAAFDTLFATNHKFYGHMDIAAFAQGGAVDGRGLQDAAVKLAAKPAKGWKVNLDVHALMVAADQGGDAGLGQEVDLWASYQATPHLGISAGGAMWLPATDLDSDTWAWLQLDAKL